MIIGLLVSSMIMIRQLDGYYYIKTDKYYSPTSTNEVGTVWPKFIADIGDNHEWRKKLDAVIDLSQDLINPQNSWLLLFDDNSKPLFCIIAKSESFNKGVRLQNSIINP